MNLHDVDIPKLLQEAKAQAQSPLDMQAKIAEIQLKILISCLSHLGTPPDGYMSDIKAFHEKFKLGYNGSPRELEQELGSFRIKFMQEELDEYREAYVRGDLEKQFDALIDLVYVALGTAYLQGLPFQQGWRRVHLANMAKVRAKKKEESKRGSEYDIVKPPGWTAPQFFDLLGTFNTNSNVSSRALKP
jgi:predicted HAD superfamily Cof-like phosphohydrolase